MSDADLTPRTKSKYRSPSFPWIDLKEAIEKARAFYREERRSAAPVFVATGHWGYKPKASSGLLCVAALKKFGLMVDEGSGEARHVRLTDLALKIILDERESSPERAEAIKKAALTPKAHRDLWDRYGPDLPSSGTIRTYLVLQREFSEDAADDLIKEYRATISFAGLDTDDRMEDGANGADEEDSDDPPVESTSRPKSGDAMSVSQPPAAVRPAEFSPASPGIQTRQFSIPLDDGKTFDLRFPTELSKEDFDFVIQNIQLWERKIVAKPKGQVQGTPSGEA